MSRIIIDGHSHLGNELFNKRKEITLKDYDDYCTKVGIDAGLLMPVPCPIIKVNNENKILLTWKYENEKFIDITEVDNLKERNLKNPYLEVNEFYFNLIKSSNTKTKVLFVPMIHPRLDTPEYIEKLILDMDPVAIKIHSVGTASSPSDLSNDVIKILQKYNIPLIVHTDYNNGKFSANEGLSKAVNKASPELWFDFFESNHIKGVLNHGATLNLDVFNKVNNSNYVMVALGPDGYLSDNYGRFKISEELFNELGFLGVLKKYVNYNKLIFDIDFDYNQLNGKLDYETLNRVKKVWPNKQELDCVLGENILTFFPKLANKL